MYVCMHVCIVCMYVCMHACMHACMHVCMYAYTIHSNIVIHVAANASLAGVLGYGGEWKAIICVLVLKYLTLRTEIS